MKRFACAATVCALAAFAAGCGRKPAAVKEAEKKAAENVVEAVARVAGAKVEFDPGRESVRVKTQEGDMTLNVGKSAGVPEKFPADVPIYKGAEVLQSMTMGENQVSLTLKIKDEMAGVSEFYKQSMLKLGWTSEACIDSAERSVQSYLKAAQRVTLMIGKIDEGGTSVMIATAPKD